MRVKANAEADRDEFISGKVLKFLYELSAAGGSGHAAGPGEASAFGWQPWPDTSTRRTGAAGTGEDLADKKPCPFCRDRDMACF